MHGYAARNGYGPLSTWHYTDGILVGRLLAPISAAVVGGATGQKAAQVCRDIMGVTSAQTLVGVMAAAGLMQNLGALRALAGEGIVSGHMRLHIDNLIMGLDMSTLERNTLKARLEAHLTSTGKVTMTDALALLQIIRLQLPVVPQ